jgi:hypothetical protein
MPSKVKKWKMQHRNAEYFRGIRRDQLGKDECRNRVLIGEQKEKRIERLRQGLPLENMEIQDIDHRITKWQ